MTVTAVAGLVGLFVVFGVLGPLLLYVLVRNEHDQREQMDRESAELTARRDRNGE